jgi:hypothetical protein
VELKVDIPRVIKALQESENDPDAAIRSLTGEADEREAEAEALRHAASAVRLLTMPDGNGASPTKTPTPLTVTSAEAEPASTDTPKGMDAVRRIMREGGVYNGRSLLDEMTRRGWEPKDVKHPLATVEAAMDRLFRVKEELVRVNRGEYTYKGHPASPDLDTLMGSAEP